LTPTPVSTHQPVVSSFDHDEHEEDQDDDQDDVDQLSFARRIPMQYVAAAVAALVVASTVGVFGARKYFMAAPTVCATRPVTISTHPPGAQVGGGGQRSGVTPLTRTLKTGPHNVELRGAGEPRAVPVTITANTQVTQYIELPNTTAFGQLQVRTEPAGAQVTVDGIPRGKSPVLVEALAAGAHPVVLGDDGANTNHTLSGAAGTTASLGAALATGGTEP